MRGERAKRRDVRPVALKFNIEITKTLQPSSYSCTVLGKERFIVLRIEVVEC